MKTQLAHDPEGWACNMGWAVLDENGERLYRGPEWAARGRAETPWAEWPENVRFIEQAEAFGQLLQVVKGAAA